MKFGKIKFIRRRFWCHALFLIIFPKTNSKVQKINFDVNYDFYDFQNKIFFGHIVRKQLFGINANFKTSI
jgi:hypothetical protein